MEARQDIIPRNIHFAVGDVQDRYWHSGDATKTIFLDALSIMFPHGERFFMDSVRANMGSVDDPQLKADVKGFLHQEATHTREHIEYNERLDDLGYPAARLDQSVKDRFAFVKKRFSSQRQLAITCALEHFTAIIAHEVLTNEVHFEGAHPTFKCMWQWHALEEVEHRSVAYNVFEKAVGRGLSAYFLRARIMLLTTLIFNIFIWNNVYAMMKADGLSKSPKAWFKMFGQLLGKPGLLRRIALPWLSYFKPGFHPQAHGDVHNADEIEAALMA